MKKTTNKNTSPNDSVVRTLDVVNLIKRITSHSFIRVQ